MRRVGEVQLVVRVMAAREVHEQQTLRGQMKLYMLLNAVASLHHFSLFMMYSDLIGMY